jgi:DNA-directed RNA polymerase subunit K/omega
MEDQRNVESSISPEVSESSAAPDDNGPGGEPMVPAEPAPPITSRFLYVDVAALRAKQLRRGARLRFDLEPGIPTPKKPERQAMEEVRRCLVQYTVPIWKGVRMDDQE